MSEPQAAAPSPAREAGFGPLQALRESYADAIRGGDILTARALATQIGVTGEELACHLRGDQLWKETLPDTAFDDYEALAPGRFDVRVLNQDQVWVDVLRRPHQITDRDDFSDDYLRAVVGMCRREAWRWVSSGGSDFREEMEATPLVRALLAEATRRGIELDEPSPQAP